MHCIGKYAQLHLLTTFFPPLPPPSCHLLSTFTSAFTSAFSPSSPLLWVVAACGCCLPLVLLVVVAEVCHLWLSSAIHATHGHPPLVVVCCLWLSATHGCPPLMVVHHSWSSTAHGHLPTNTVVVQVIVCVCAHMCVSKLSNRKVHVKKVYCVTLGSFAHPPPSHLPTTTVVVQVIAYQFMPLMVIHHS